MSDPRSCWACKKHDNPENFVVCETCWNFKHPLTEDLRARAEAAEARCAELEAQNYALSKGSIGIAAMTRLLAIEKPSAELWMSNMCNAWKKRCEELQAQIPPGGARRLADAEKDVEYYLGHWKQEIVKHTKTTEKLAAAEARVRELVDENNRLDDARHVEHKKLALALEALRGIREHRYYDYDALSAAGQMARIASKALAKLEGAGGETR